MQADTDLSTGGAAEVSLRAAGVAALEDMAWLHGLREQGYATFVGCRWDFQHTGHLSGHFTFAVFLYRRLRCKKADVDDKHA